MKVFSWDDSPLVKERGLGVRSTFARCTSPTQSGVLRPKEVSKGGICWSMSVTVKVDDKSCTRRDISANSWTGRFDLFIMTAHETSFLPRIDTISTCSELCPAQNPSPVSPKGEKLCAPQANHRLGKPPPPSAKNKSRLHAPLPWEPAGCSPALHPTHDLLSKSGASVAKGQTDTPINRHNRAPH
jgi:hypothetical protein